MPNRKITFTEHDLTTLKKLYEQSVADNKEKFIFKKKEFLTAYAKYLIEWMETQFKNKQ